MVETPRDKKRISATVLPPRAGDFTLRSCEVQGRRPGFSPGSPTEDDKGRLRVSVDSSNFATPSCRNCYSKAGALSSLSYRRLEGIVKDVQKNPSSADGGASRRDALLKLLLPFRTSSRDSHGYAAR